MNYTYPKMANLDKLTKELSGFPLLHLTQDGSDLIVTMTSVLDQNQQNDLSTVVGLHSTSDMSATVRKAILRAMTFGKEIMAEYGSSNVLAGLTVEEVQDIMDRTARVKAALDTGSLYVAINEINAIVPDATFITVAKLTEFRNKIEDYLGIPRT